MPKSKPQQQQLFTDEMARNSFVFDTGEKRPYRPTGMPRGKTFSNALVYKFARVNRSHKSPIR